MDVSKKFWSGLIFCLWISWSISMAVSQGTATSATARVLILLHEPPPAGHTDILIQRRICPVGSRVQTHPGGSRKGMNSKSTGIGWRLVQHGFAPWPPSAHFNFANSKEEKHWRLTAWSSELLTTKHGSKTSIPDSCRQTLQTGKAQHFCVFFNVKTCVIRPLCLQSFHNLLTLKSPRCTALTEQCYPWVPRYPKDLRRIRIGHDFLSTFIKCAQYRGHFFGTWLSVDIDYQ